MSDQDLRRRIGELCHVEDRYDELLSAARRVLRYNGVDNEIFNAALKVLDNLIQRHLNEETEDKLTNWGEE